MAIDNSGAFKNNVDIFAIGGGGFTHEQTSDKSDSILEDYLLSLS